MKNSDERNGLTGEMVQLSVNAVVAVGVSLAYSGGRQLVILAQLLRS